jgi:glycosyltransferase involved in cell wall biosynthesis
MAYGRPVVATAVGGLRDAVADGETGVLVEPGSTGALRAAIETLLGDAGLRARLGERARAAGAGDAGERLLDCYAVASGSRRRPG